MSGERLLPWDEAVEIARGLVEQLRPHVDRVKVVGSVRRRKRHVRDVELLIQPRMIVTDLLGTETPDLEPIRVAVRSWGQLSRLGDRYIRIEASPCPIDLFLCHPPAQWGSLLAIRTGPSALAKHAVSQLARRGYPHRDGGIRHRGEPVPVPDEETLFRLAGLPCLPPAQRHTPAAFVEVPAGSAARKDGVA